METNNNPEPLPIGPKGEVNNAQWTKWYMDIKGCHYVIALRAFNERLLGYPEPKITDDKGNISKRWITWYKVRTKVSDNTAIGAGKRKLASIEAGKPDKREHLSYWWRDIANPE